jgi:hypothetical protein
MDMASGFGISGWEKYSQGDLHETSSCCLAAEVIEIYQSPSSQRVL